MIALRIKPLSINECWRGRRFKTKEYQRYEKTLLLMLPNIELPEPPFKVFYEFGLSNSCADIDNPVKAFSDILQKKYGFNDNKIYEMHVVKTKVKKGEEFIHFWIENYLKVKT